MLERAAALKSADNAARLAFLDEEYILGHPRLLALLDELSDIVRHPNPEKCYRIVFSKSYNGKSTTIDALKARFPINENLLGDAASAPVVAIQMPSVASVREFAINILTAVNEPFNPRWSGTHLLSAAYACLRTLETKALVIDEFQQLEQGHYLARASMTNIIKSLGATCGVAVLAFGMPSAIDVIEGEPQLQRRFRHRVILPWQYGDEVGDLIDDFEARLPLRLASNLRDHPILLNTLVDLGENVIGHIKEAVIAAAKHAIISGKEQIDAGVLASMDWVKPSLRTDDSLKKLELAPNDPQRVSPQYI